jgi:hypothetical protein
MTSGNVILNKRIRTLSDIRNDDEDASRNSKKALHSIDQPTTSSSLVDPNWELIDPTPDIHALFIAFDAQYFDGALIGCEVRWSPRMTL